MALVCQCLKDVTTFCLFYGFFLCIFGLLFVISGVSFTNEEDYLVLSPSTQLCIQVFRNSIGDLATPQYQFWVDQSAKHSFISGSMILIAWTVWVLETFFVLIVLLNFMIAIVSQSYEEVMSKRMVHKYLHIADMNTQSRTILSILDMD